MFNGRRSDVSGSDERCRRVCKAFTCNCFQSYRKCWKTVPFSIRIWKSETIICDMDCDRIWRFYCVKRNWSCKDSRNHNRKDRWLWDGRSDEYGGLHGASSGRSNLSAFCGFWVEAWRLWCSIYRRSWRSWQEDFVAFASWKWIWSFESSWGLWNWNLWEWDAGYSFWGLWLCL